jgi:hypothetical protein
VEIAAGLIYGSMALLADGLHRASPASAPSIAVLAYVRSRRLAADPPFTFGVGKINTLAGFASAVMLLGFALAMTTESMERLLHPVTIAFDHALIAAVIGYLTPAQRGPRDGRGTPMPAGAVTRAPSLAKVLPRIPTTEPREARRIISRHRSSGVATGLPKRTPIARIDRRGPIYDRPLAPVP